MSQKVFQRLLLPVMFASCLLPSCEKAPVIESQEPRQGARIVQPTELVGLYQAVVLRKASHASIDTYVALMDDGNLVDPPEELFEQLPENFFPLSKTDFVHREPVLSHRTDNRAELIYIDVMRIEPPRHYVLVTRYTNSLGSETSFMTVIPFDREWVVATECPMTIS